MYVAEPHVIPISIAGADSEIKAPSDVFYWKTNAEFKKELQHTTSLCIHRLTATELSVLDLSFLSFFQ